MNVPVYQQWIRWKCRGHGKRPNPSEAVTGQRPLQMIPRTVICWYVPQKKINMFNIHTGFIYSLMDMCLWNTMQRHLSNHPLNSGADVGCLPQFCEKKQVWLGQISYLTLDEAGIGIDWWIFIAIFFRNRASGHLLSPMFFFCHASNERKIRLIIIHYHNSGQIIATSHDRFPPKVAFWKGNGTPAISEKIQVGEILIIIWPDNSWRSFG